MSGRCDSDHHSCWRWPPANHFGSRWSHRPGVSRLFRPISGADGPGALRRRAALIALILRRWRSPTPWSGAFVGCLLVLGPALLLLSALKSPRGGADRAGRRRSRGRGGVRGQHGGVRSRERWPAPFCLLPYMAPATAAGNPGGGIAGRRGGGAWPLRARSDDERWGWCRRASPRSSWPAITLLAPPDRVDLGDLRLEHVETVRKRPRHGRGGRCRTRGSGPGRCGSISRRTRCRAPALPNLPGEPLFYIALAEAALEAMMPERGRVRVLGLAGGIHRAGACRCRVRRGGGRHQPGGGPDRRALVRLSIRRPCR